MIETAVFGEKHAWRARQAGRAFLRLFEPRNWFVVVTSLVDAGSGGIAASSRRRLVADSPPRGAIAARRSVYGDVRPHAGRGEPRDRRPSPGRDDGRRRRTGTPSRLAAVLFGVVLALLLTETAFRATGLGVAPAVKCRLRRDDFSPGELVYGCYPSNPSGEFQLAPDVSSGVWRLTKLLVPTVPLPLSDLPRTPWCVEYRRVSPEVRGPAVADAPGPDVVRFAGIGDSFAMGEGVPYEKTLFARLAALLGDGYEVLNCAASGFDTTGEIRQMEFVVPRYGCRRALVVYNLNDVAPAPQIRSFENDTYDLVNLRAEPPRDDARPWCRRAFRVAEFFASALEVRQITRETVAGYLDAYDPAKNGANLAVLEAQFRRLADWPGCRVGLVIYPMMYRLEGPYPLQPCHDAVARMARAAGLPVLDLAPAFAGQDTRSLQVHPIDHHPNGRAHEIAARAIAPWILEQPTLR